MTIANEQSSRCSSHRGRVEEYIAQAGGYSVVHPGGNLASHLGRVAAILERWGVERTIVDAGHLHAAYGTDGFGVSFTGPEGQRELIELVGEETETLISLYCHCDRDASYPSWDSNNPVVIDRSRGKAIPIDEAQRKGLVSITVANEIDVLSHDANLMQQHGYNLSQLFKHWRDWLTKPALEDLDKWISTIAIQSD